MATGTAIEVVMPQMGVSISEGTVTRWLKNVGDPIAADEPLLEISTDKVDTEVPSPGSGVLQAIIVNEGETVPVGTLLARIGAGEASGLEQGAPGETRQTPSPLPVEAEYEPAAAVYEPSDVDEETALEEDDFEDEPVSAPVAASAPPAPAAPAAPPMTGNGSGARHTFVSPVVARIASEHGIDPAAVPGTGREGRVTKKDILAFVEGGGAAAPAEPAPAQA